MFAKGIPKGHETHIKESDKRKWREKISSHFPTLQPSQLEMIAPKKADDMTINKISKTEQIVRVNEQPVFFDWDRVEMIPTCYTLHIAPQVSLQHEW